MCRRYYRSIVTVGVLSGTTASVPLWYRPNTVRGLFERNFGRYLARYYRLNCFFRFSSLSGTSGLVPLQYRFNTVRVLFERNFDRYLDRYFRFSSFCSFSPLSGTSGPVPVRYRFDTVGNFTQAVPGPVHGPVLRPQAVLPLGWAVLPPSIDLLYFLLSL